MALPSNVSRSIACVCRFSIASPNSRALLSIVGVLASSSTVFVTCQVTAVFAAPDTVNVPEARHGDATASDVVTAATTTKRLTPIFRFNGAPRENLRPHPADFFGRLRRGMGGRRIGGALVVACAALLMVALPASRAAAQSPVFETPLQTQARTGEPVMAV